MDDLSGDNQGFSSQDPNNNNGEKAVSDYDVKHRFVNSVNYALPFGHGGPRVVANVVRGWEDGSIITMQSGLPFTPGIRPAPANTGSSLRPDRLGAGTAAGRTLFPDFDTSAF